MRRSACGTRVLRHDGWGQTTFFHNGYSYTLLQEYTLRDTVQLALPFGQFNTCAWLTAKVTLSAGGQ